MTFQLYHVLSMKSILNNRCSAQGVGRLPAPGKPQALIAFAQLYIVDHGSRLQRTENAKTWWRALLDFPELAHPLKACYRLARVHLRIRTFTSTHSLRNFDSTTRARFFIPLAMQTRFAVFIGELSTLLATCHRNNADRSITCPKARFRSGPRMSILALA